MLGEVHEFLRADIGKGRIVDQQARSGGAELDGLPSRAIRALSACAALNDPLQGIRAQNDAMVSVPAERNLQLCRAFTGRFLESRRLL